MANFLIILILVAAVLLTLLVLVQNSKGGGLASGFASGNQVMGAPKTADFLEKATWALIAIIVLLSIFAVGALKNKTNVVNEGTSIAAEAAEVADANAPAEDAAAFNEDVEAEEAE